MTNKSAIILIVSIFTLTGLNAVSAENEAVKANWKTHCSKCHGEDGKGQTKMGKKLEVLDYTDPAVQANFKEEEMLAAIRDGRKDKDSGKYRMKPLAKKLSEVEMKELVAFTRTLAKAP